MFIAHAPAGYLLLKALAHRSGYRISLWLTGLIFAVVPDFDLIWFYAFNSRTIPHHQYVTHWPLFWLVFFGSAFAFAAVLRKSSWRPYLWTGLYCVMLHLALDSIAAEILWLAPFSQMQINLVEVPSIYNWWVWNFLLHWTFALELLICALALIVFLRTRRKKR
jgi:inner membrane protein